MLRLKGAGGGISLHNRMSPHGPDRSAFEKATTDDWAPVKRKNTVSFMFETRFPQHPTRFAAEEAPLQDDHVARREGLEKTFDRTPGLKQPRSLACHRRESGDPFAIRPVRAATCPGFRGDDNDDNGVGSREDHRI